MTCSQRWAAVVVALVAGVALAKDFKKVGAISQAEERATLRLMKQVEAAFNSKDADAFATLYLENGTLGTAMGDRLTGREEIRRMMKKEFAGELKNAKFSFRLDTLNKLSDTLMLADITNTITGIQFPGTKDQPPAKLFVVLMKQGTDWRVAATRSQIDMQRPTETGVGGSGKPKSGADAPRRQ